MGQPDAQAGAELRHGRHLPQLVSATAPAEVLQRGNVREPAVPAATARVVQGPAAHHPDLLQAGVAALSATVHRGTHPATMPDRADLSGGAVHSGNPVQPTRAMLRRSSLPGPAAMYTEPAMLSTPAVLHLVAGILEPIV